jgi:hypothetical protein
VRKQSQQGPKQNGLAGAVGPDHREGLALFQCEGDILENRKAVQCHGKVFDGQDGVVGHAGLEFNVSTYHWPYHGALMAHGLHRKDRAALSGGRGRRHDAGLHPVFEILMAAALVALIVTRRRWRLPPVWLPLALFLLGTLVSLFASGHIRDGLPQVRKFYVYLMLFLVTSAPFERCGRFAGWRSDGRWQPRSRHLWALKQFFEKYRAAELAHQNFYTSYVDARITGFMGHWMTLSGS